MTEQDIKRASKTFSHALRHAPEALNLRMDAQGWVMVDELLLQFSKKHFGITFQDLEKIVAENNKKRFAFNEDFTKIRASQGHSLDFVQMDYVPVEPPEVLYHGTGTNTVAIIKEEGIKKLTRQYVHLSQDTETANNVGSRHGKPFIFTVLAKKMHEAGHLFFQSENGVWLTDFVPIEFLKKD